ncbi:hypothetical protein AVEN_214861-1 [Araneus ventricosus]|uniref:Uncharacterized protein n=1 Tax=Araneus ventricosus TaxID=182803 RepID=A0A4Y2HKE4_ARAVE|nr:hypothetical protein AVEN_214861-1 [Araneus ventricosus]
MGTFQNEYECKCVSKHKRHRMDENLRHVLPHAILSILDPGRKKYVLVGYTEGVNTKLWDMEKKASVSVQIRVIFEKMTSSLSKKNELEPIRRRKCTILRQGRNQDYIRT